MMKIWVLVLAVLAVAFLQRLLIFRFGMKNLKYKRQLSPKAVFSGETVEMIETLENPSFLFIPWIRVESRVSPYLRFGRQENLKIAGEKYQYHKSIFSLLPFQKVIRHHKVKAIRRGKYDVGSVALTAGDLISDASNSIEMKFPAKMTVYPALIPENELPDIWPKSRNQGDIPVNRQYLSDPFLVCGIRGYQYGDSPRDIHWSATARTGQMQVKVHDFTADTQLMIFLNGQKRPDQWNDLMEYEQIFLEYGISLTASIMLKVLQSGAAAGFASNMPFENEEKCAFLPLAAGNQYTQTVLEALSSLRIHQVRSFISFLDEMMQVKDADILILSCYDDELLEEKMNELRRKNKSVTIHLIDDKGES